MAKYDSCMSYVKRNQYSFSRQSVLYHTSSIEKIRVSVGFNILTLKRRVYIEKGYILQLHQSYKDPDSALISVADITNSTTSYVSDLLWYENRLKLYLFNLNTNNNLAFYVRAFLINFIDKSKHSIFDRN